jgi:hypothetical protein
MKQLQTVYIPTKVELEDYHFHDKSFEAFVFTPEELKQLLEEYTNRIVENVKIDRIYECVDIKSITSQLELFKKEIGL